MKSPDVQQLVGVAGFVSQRQILQICSPDIPSGLTELRIGAMSPHASEGPDVTATFDNNAKCPLVLRAAELELSVSQSDRDVSDNAIRLRSGRDFCHSARHPMHLRTETLVHHVTPMLRVSPY